jgi:hypothetical protein
MECVGVSTLYFLSVMGRRIVAPLIVMLSMFLMYVCLSVCPGAALWATCLLFPVCIRVLLLVELRDYSMNEAFEPCLMQDDSSGSLNDGSPESPPLCAQLTVLLNALLQVVAFAFSALLVGGCWVQALGWRDYSANGNFITLSYATGHTQRILTQCVGAARAPNVTTIWMEVGGGGHSMSDVWGVRDYIVAHYPEYRYCSYDMPGTGA